MKCIPVKLFQREDVTTPNPSKTFNHRLCKEVNESILNFRYDTNSTNIIQNPRTQKGIKVLNLILPKHIHTENSTDHVTNTSQWKNKKIRTNNNYIDNNNLDNNQNKKLRQNKKLNKLKIKSPKSIINSSPVDDHQCSASSSTITECSRSVSTTDKDLTSTATITNIIAQSFAQNNDRVQRKMQQTISYFDIDDKSLITEMSKNRELPRNYHTSNRSRKIVGRLNNNYQPKLPVLSSPAADYTNEDVDEIVNNSEESNCRDDAVVAAPLPLTIISSSRRKKKKKTISISLTQRARHTLGERSPSPETTGQIIRVDVTSNLSIEYDGYSTSNATSRSSRSSSPRCNNNKHVSQNRRSSTTRRLNKRNKTKFSSGMPSTTTCSGAANKVFKYNYYHQVATATARKKMIVRKKEIKLNVPCLKLELNLRNSN